jgi:chemotaxis protein methyltransferase CheR
MMDFQNLDAQTLAQAIVNTIPEPFIVLDHQFRVLSASVSFYQTFKVDPEDTRGRLLYSLGDGQWDIPALRVLLETIIPERTAMDGFEVEHDFPTIGRKTMLLNARQVIYEDSSETTKLLRQKDVLLQEMQHRVANSLQIIASILLLKARAVSSEETRQHLHDAHQRVMSVAEVQRHLNTSEDIDQIDVGSYLSKLCGSLASSMVGESQPIAVQVMADKGKIGSDKAVSLGLIVTELVINAVKYAFPAAKADALILVTYEVDDLDWKLTVSDNGCGKINDVPGAKLGLGTAIVQALVKQLGAVVETVSGSDGVKIAITRATFMSRMPQAA